MKAYIFFSVHVPLFDGILQRLQFRGLVTKASGFVWGNDQVDQLSNSSFPYDEPIICTRDILAVSNGSPDSEYLQWCEKEFEVPLAKMIASERHLTRRYGFDRVLSIAEHTFRTVSSHLEREAPDFLLSEDVSCLTSYIHWAVARKHKIPFIAISSARIPGRIVVYRDGLQEWDSTNARYEELLSTGLSEAQRVSALDFVESFRQVAARPTGMAERARLPLATRDDLRRVTEFGRRYLRDPMSPVLTFPVAPLFTRARRLTRAAIAKSMFEQPREGERYVLYPIHLQPEASTLVQAPYYLNQVALIEDLVKSLPAGTRLYVKDHVSTRGRWPLSLYRAIKKCFGVRLIAPDADVPTLIRNADAVAVITGTMGWEAVLLDKPAVTFGDVFFNVLPQVLNLGVLPKNQWAAELADAIEHPRSDEKALLSFVTAMLETSFPGFMANPSTFPSALSPENLDLLTEALCTRIEELRPRKPEPLIASA
ncbi:MAG: hypothetical protein WBN29_02705 [Polyangiales bacterium]